MRAFVTALAVLTAAAAAFAQTPSPAPGPDSSDVVAAAVGAMITAVLGAIGYMARELVVKTRERNANRAVFELLYALLDRVTKEAGHDWLAPQGLYYRHQLSSELARLAREKRDLIGGDTFLDLVRLSSALRMFSFERGHADSSVYSVDELVREACVTLKRIVPRIVRSRAKRREELNRIEQIRQLMLKKFGEPKLLSKSSSNAADTHA